MRIVVLIVFLVPLTSFGQFKLKGMVRDSVAGATIPGVNVEIKDQNKKTATDSNGEFEIESTIQTAQVTFSFVGFATKIQTVDAKDDVIIDLAVDKELLEEDLNHIKASLDLGYFGDKNYAPTGLIVTYSLQSVGRTQLGINSNVKYWSRGENSGAEFLISKNLNGKLGYLADDLLLSYKSIDYDESEFSLKQTRALVANEFKRLFAIDIGVSYNDFVQNTEQGLISEQYVGGIIGVTKIFSAYSFLKNWGLHSSLNYHSKRTFYEIGTYKGIYIKKFPAMILMAKYYDYDVINGVLLSVRFNLFSTRYYCCHSWKVYYGDINALK